MLESPDLKLDRLELCCCLLLLRVDELADLSDLGLKLVEVNLIISFAFPRHARMSLTHGVLHQPLSQTLSFVDLVLKE